MKSNRRQFVHTIGTGSSGLALGNSLGAAPTQATGAHPDKQVLLVGDNIAHQLQQRISFRRAMKRAVQGAMRSGAEGIKVQVAGRLGGAEIARTEGYHEGRVPLHTLRADIDYAQSTARTTYGTIGIKVWIFKGEVVEDRRGRTYSTGA